jgi:exoribonuclease R
MAAAALMLRAGCGILRTQPKPDERSLARPAPAGRGARHRLAARDAVRRVRPGLDPARAAHAALMHEATSVGRAAGYTPFDGAPPEDAEHFAVAAAYAHATAPLRRLQDRYVSECCLAACAGTAPPDWVRAGLAALPEAMAAGQRRANTVERGVVDLVEAVLLAGREGEVFDAVVIDDHAVQLRDPAVRGRVEPASPEPGTEVRVRLDQADPATRRVVFSVAA